MRANLGALFDHDHRQLFTVCCSQLRQATGGGETGSPPTDDHYIEFHRFSFGLFRHT
jgi:hypothetical protein